MDAETIVCVNDVQSVLFQEKITLIIFIIPVVFIPQSILFSFNTISIPVILVFMNSSIISRLFCCLALIAVRNKSG